MLNALQLLSSHLLTPELLLRSHSAHIPKEYNEENDGSNVVQSTELLTHTGSSDEEGSISNTEGEEDDNDEEDKEEEEEEYYNEEQATSQPTEQLKSKTKVGRSHTVVCISTIYCIYSMSVYLNPHVNTADLRCFPWPHGVRTQPSV